MCVCARMTAGWSGAALLETALQKGNRLQPSGN